MPGNGVLIEQRFMLPRGLVRHLDQIARQTGRSRLDVVTEALARIERYQALVAAARQWLMAESPRQYQLADGDLQFALDELDELEDRPDRMTAGSYASATIVRVEQRRAEEQRS